MDPSKTDRSELINRIRKTADDLQKLVQSGGENLDTQVKSALQAAYGSIQQALQMAQMGSSEQREGLAPTGSMENTEMDNMKSSDPAGGTDRSSGDPIDEVRTEVHPDDISAPPSNTGHREVHPDDAE